MRAVVLREHGGLDKLRLEPDFPDPAAGEGDVVLRVRASSLNYHDVFTRRGMPGIKVPLPVIIGLDIAGEIVAVGPGVTGWAAGDRVLVDPINRVEGGLMGETVNGGLAEYCRARAHQLIRIPANLTFAQAAALPVAYGTALRMMTTVGGVSRGEKVLILGASGGVGVCCVQLAKLAGAHVIACAGSAQKGERLEELGADEIILYTQEDFLKVVQERHGKPARRRHARGGGVDVVVNYTGGEKVLILGASGGVGVCCVQLAKLAGAHVIACAGSAPKGERLEELGADEIILYTQEDFLRVVQERHGKPARRRHARGGGVDVVVNYTGGDTWVKSLRSLRLGGRLLTCGATAGFDPKEDLRFIWTFELKILGSNGWDRGDIESLFELVASGKLKVLIERTYPLEEAVEAVRAIEERKVFGKVVVTP